MFKFCTCAQVASASSSLLFLGVCVYGSLPSVCLTEVATMGRGVSSGGGQSSLGYLFGSGEAPKAAPKNPQTPTTEAEAMPPSKPAAPPVDIPKDIPADIHSTCTNNYLRADGQNSGNFITV